MKLVVGLGNPGKTYDGTRHNLGFAVADFLAQRWQLRWRRGKCEALSCQKLLPLGPVLLIKPQTFMNRSGLAAACFRRMFDLEVSDLVAIHDDIDLSLGRVRVKMGGGSGGHRGVESLIGELAADGFVRVRVGVGRPPPDEEAAEHVLQPFSPCERKIVAPSIARAADAVESLLTSGLVPTLNAFNATT